MSDPSAYRLSLSVKSHTEGISSMFLSVCRVLGVQQIQYLLLQIWIFQKKNESLALAVDYKHQLEYSELTPDDIAETF